jgi:hypothetical protein
MFVKHAKMERFGVTPWVSTPTWIPYCRELIFIWILDSSLFHLLTLLSLQAIVLSHPMMEITLTSSSCAPSIVTGGYFDKLPNHPQSLLLNLSWNCMVSRQDPGFFVWIKEANFGVRISYVTSLRQLDIPYNPQVSTRRLGMVRVSGPTAPSVQWYADFSSVLI